MKLSIAVDCIFVESAIMRHIWMDKEYGNNRDRRKRENFVQFYNSIGWNESFGSRMDELSEIGSLCHSWRHIFDTIRR
jgi:hypothetical protein